MLKRKKRRWIATSFIITLSIISVYLTFYFVQASHEVEIENDKQSPWARLFPFGKDREEDPNYKMPSEEKDRLDILIMGIRGNEDKDGGMLTDTMILFSYDKKTKKSAMVSIPRDLYVKINENRMDKINSAYSWLGLSGAKRLVSKVTGVYVDNVIVFDFTAFHKIVDTLGGVDITLDHPFEETQQWGYTFSLPAGQNHLNGEQALYYVRSRYSSSDFDRARRQQQVIFAIKNKVEGLDILSDPIRTLSLINTVRSNIKTDINLLDTKTYVSLAQNVTAGSMKRHVITTIDLLYETHVDGMYVLLPQGDNFDRLKYYFKTILGEATPLPSPSATP